VSKIEWTGKTWNPVGGCKPISPGCANCYAEVMTGRLEAMGQASYAGLTRPGMGRKLRMFTGEFREFPDKLDVPLRRKVPTTYFVNSMSDLFGEGVSDEYIAAVFGVMAACPQHTFQVLTKRAERLDLFTPAAGPWIAMALSSQLLGDINKLSREQFERIKRTPLPLPNVHLGVSVEDRKHGLPRINELRKVPAVVRFLSIEPLLEDLGTIDLTGIHWVIVGGESGHNARPMHPDWVRSIRDQCVASGVPFFFKQWGEWEPCGVNAPDAYLGDGSERVGVRKVGKKNAGRVLDGRTWDEVPR
jgi:protein gp37